MLSRLPPGTVVDGELVVLRDGRADFPALLRRHQRQLPSSLMTTCSAQPAIAYMLFDLLFAQGQSLLQETLVKRRKRLQDLLVALKESLLVYSDDVVGCGRAFFADAVAQGHEGVMAKNLVGC